MLPTRLFAAMTSTAAALGQLHVQATLLRPRADAATFQLFAYGGAIGGLSIFYQDGVAVITDMKTANESSLGLVPVVFTANSDAVLSATPNKTAASSPFNNATFFVPGASSSSHQVGFTNGTTSGDILTKGWGFFGHNVLFEGDGGSMISLFGAVPSAVEGIWTLTWNVTETDGAVTPVALKDTPPPNLP